MTTDQKICNTLLDMMETQHINKIKVSELIKLADVSRSTFYFYFDSISAVMEQIEKDFIINFSDDATTTYRMLLRKQRQDSYNVPLRPALTALQKELRIFRILSGPNNTEHFQELLRERITRIYFMNHTSSSKSEKEKHMICELLSGGQWYIYKYWANHPDELTLDDVVSFLSRFCTAIDEFI